MHAHLEASHNLLCIGAQNRCLGLSHADRRGCRPAPRRRLLHIRHQVTASTGQNSDAAKPTSEQNKKIDKPVSRDARQTTPPRQAAEPAKPVTKVEAPQPKADQAAKQQTQPTPREAPKALKQAPVQQRKHSSTSGGHGMESDWGSAENRPDRTGALRLMTAQSLQLCATTQASAAAICRLLHDRFLCPWCCPADNYPFPSNR